MDVMIAGKPKLLNSRYADVWVKGVKGWQMVVWQREITPGDPAAVNASRAGAAGTG